MSGMFYCPRCGQKSATWQNDFDAEEAGYIEDGIVSYYSCWTCGSEIEVFTPSGEEEDD